METLIENVAWRRRGSAAAYIGSVRAGDSAIRLSGRDPLSGIDVTLSIPLAEVKAVYVPGGSRDLEVMVDLDDAEPVFLRPIGAGPLHVQLLARRLDAFVCAPRMLVKEVVR